jgi:hypothetical protein
LDLVFHISNQVFHIWYLGYPHFIPTYAQKYRVIHRLDAFASSFHAYAYSVHHTVTKLLSNLELSLLNTRVHADNRTCALLSRAAGNCYKS